MGPIDGCAQRLLARGSVAGSRPACLEGGIKPFRDLRRGQQPATRGGELDREWQAVDAPADVGDRRRGVLAEPERRIVGASALDEQRERSDLGRRDAAASAPGGERQWGTGWRCSALTFSGSRLVASTVIPGQPSSSALTNAAPGRTCSKLSSTSRTCLAARKRAIACSCDSPGSATIASASMIAEGISSGLRSAASETKYAASAKSASTSRATSIASRVFPTPPGPVRVSSRTAPSRSRPAATSISPRGRSSGSAGRAREGAVGARGGLRPLERGTMGQDPLLQTLQRRAGLEAELVDEAAPALPVGVKRVGLATAAIQSDHQLGVEALAPRMLSRELLKLADQLRVAPYRQVGLDAQLQGGRGVAPPAG